VAHLALRNARPALTYNFIINAYFIAASIFCLFSCLLLKVISEEPTWNYFVFVIKDAHRKLSHKLVIKPSLSFVNIFKVTFS